MMANFCKQCSEHLFGTDFENFKGNSTKEDTEKGLYVAEICEGCGFIQVNHKGECVSPDCLKNHGQKNKK